MIMHDSTNKEQTRLDKIELQGANSAAFQIIYDYPQIPENPYPEGTKENEHWQIGYQAERAIRGY